MSRKKKRIEKVCEQCKKEFKVRPFKANQRFCSKNCWYLWKSKNLCGECGANWQGGNVKKSCKWCGKEFGVKPSRADEKRFCSQKCWYLWASKNQRGKNNPGWKRVKKICGQCGKEFEAAPSANRQFCSRKCWYLWTSKNRRGENHPGWNEKVKKICEWCGGEFKVWPSRADKARFWSRECAGLAISGENGPNWQGGISFEPYGLEWTETLKRKIRKRDNYICAISREHGCVVHHIDYNKINCIPKNLITLCVSCHSKTNVNRDLWQALLGPIAQSRETGNPIELAEI